MGEKLYHLSQKQGEKASSLLTENPERRSVSAAEESGGERPRVFRDARAVTEGGVEE
jgi:hypothetical protein